MIFWNLIAGCANLFLLIFCFHLFFSARGNKLLNRLLMVPFLARVGQDIVFMLINSQQLVNYPQLLKIFSPLSFAAPACFYLYVRSFLHRERKLNKLDLLHFIIPAGILIESFYTLFFSGIDLRMVAQAATENGIFFAAVKSGVFPVYYYYFGRHTLFLVYLFLAWREYLNSALAFRTQDKEKRWMLAILISTTLAHITSIALVISHWIPESPEVLTYLVPALITLKYLSLLGFIIYMVHQPALLYNYLLFKTEGLEEEKNEVPVEELKISRYQINETETAEEKVIKKLKLPTEQAEAYIALIQDYMEKEQPYLNSNFQMLDLAKDLEIPSHHCSYLINNLLGKNFRDWVNAYRIQSFIDSYPDKASSMTVDGVAFESGFNSVSTFYRAFKKEKGLMPLAYFKDLERLSA